MSFREAERLKCEAGALFLNNDFAGAYDKYTEAIRHDDKNASLYCNRATASLALNRYMDASADARKATELHPTYAKAWARLARARTGLHRYDLAVEAWQRALAALPTDNLTSTEQEQTDHYRKELASVKAKLSTQTRRPAVVIQNELEKLPWNRAAALLPDLTAHGVWDSSAWIIDYAHTEWKRVYHEIMRGGYTETLDGRCYSAGFGLIEGLTNAIVADRRIFHIADNNFPDKYNSQLIFEISMIRSGNWTSLGSKRVIEEVPRRLKAEARGAGWSTVRPALSLAIRSWIMRGVVESGLKDSPETALEFLTSAVEVLTWVGERYKDVPDNMKGAIFRPTFIRAVKSMRLDIFRLAYAKHPGMDSKYPLTDLQAGANEILTELGDVPMQPYVDSVGFYHAFFRYPAGQAHAIRAFCHRANAMLLRQAQGVTPEVCSLFRMAGQEYTEATKYYPLDEECSTLYAYCAFQGHWEAGAPLKYLLLLLDQMDKSIPLMKRIWEFSADASSGRDALFQRALDQRDVWWDNIRNGRISEDSFVQKVG